MYTKYRDQKRTSRIDCYEIGDDYIKIKFKNSKIVYVYTYVKPGKEMVDNLKSAAQNNSGLTHYLDSHCLYMHEYEETYKNK